MKPIDDSGRRHITSDQQRHYAVRHGQGGYSMIEMLAVLGLLGIAFAAAAPTIKPAWMDISNAQSVLIANLRLARTNAITRGVHYAVAFASATTLELQRMQLQNGAWTVDASQTQTVNLPPDTQLPIPIVGTSVEFNTRGQAVNLLTVEQIDITDSFGATRSTQAWPSGQVNEL